MFIDIAAGTVIYVFVSLMFGESFAWMPFLLTLFFALSPDSDFIPYLLLRKKLKLVSHHIIHFPLLFLPIGALLVYFLAGFYFVVLFLLAAFAHFVHDSMSETGIQWLWPVDISSYSINKGRIGVAYKRELYYQCLRQTREERSIADEVKMRMEKLDMNTGLFLTFAATVLFLFAFKFV